MPIMPTTGDSTPVNTTRAHHQTAGRGQLAARGVLFPVDADGRTNQPPTVTQLHDAAWQHMATVGALTARRLADRIPLTRGAWLLLTAWAAAGTVHREEPPAGHYAPYDTPFTLTPPSAQTTDPTHHRPTDNHLPADTETAA